MSGKPTGDAQATDDRAASSEGRPSLRADQVAQTRAALLRAARQRFGDEGFAATSVEEVARAARVTTGALYHHFPTKSALFETVFLELHAELMVETSAAAAGTADAIEALARGFDAFFDAVLRPDVQRILITDAPAVLGLARFTELDEQDAFPAIVAGLQVAAVSGARGIRDPETLARLLLGVLTRGGMLIASAPDPVEAKTDVAGAVRTLLRGLADTR
jgi:AcrR family transcriptional regulator